MSWRDRLKETIQFTSPSGQVFNPYWIGDSRSKSKKLGEFPPPKRDGTIIQDLGTSGTVYPLTVIFEGDNNDLESQRFFAACSETGEWEIVHPVLGILNLILSSITENIRPVTSGNVTTVETEWVEPLSDDQTVSDAELVDRINQQLLALNAAAAAQLEGVAKQDTASQIQAIKNSATQYIAVINNSLSRISELSTDIARITNQIQRATTSTLSNPVIVLNSLATQIQQLSQAPALATSNIQERASAYATGIAGIIGGNPGAATPEAKNTLAVKEISLAALLSTFPSIISSGEITTKTEAISLAEQMKTLLDQVTND